MYTVTETNTYSLRVLLLLTASFTIYHVQCCRHSIYVFVYETLSEQAMRIMNGMVQESHRLNGNEKQRETER